MPEPALWTLSLQAFAAVLVVLSSLAGALQALTALFRPAPAPAPAAGAGRPAAPGPEPAATGPDPFVVAAVHAAARTAHPGARVVHLEEIPSGGVDDPR